MDTNLEKRIEDAEPIFCLGRKIGKVVYDCEPDPSIVGKKGYIASLPQIISIRIKTPYEENYDGPIIWRHGFRAYSEETAGKTPQGNPVILVIHGGGIFGLPQHIKKAMDLGLTKAYTARLSNREWYDALNGKMPDNSEIPIYSFCEFKDKTLRQLPVRYGVVLDFKDALVTPPNLPYPADENKLKENHLFITRAGGIELTNQFLDVLINTELKGTCKFNHIYHDLDLTQPSGHGLQTDVGTHGGGLCTAHFFKHHGLEDDYIVMYRKWPWSKR